MAATRQRPAALGFVIQTQPACSPCDSEQSPSKLLEITPHMATPEQVSEALAQKISGPQSEGGGTSLEVLEVNVPSVSPQLLLKIKLSVSGQLWEVSLDYQGHEASLVTGDLSEEAVKYLGLLVRTHLFEWWHTKDTETLSARMGKRLD